jgi:hypothetical protein
VSPASDAEGSELTAGGLCGRRANLGTRGFELWGSSPGTLLGTEVGLEAASGLRSQGVSDDMGLQLQRRPDRPG